MIDDILNPNSPLVDVVTQPSTLDQNSPNKTLGQGYLDVNVVTQQFDSEQGLIDHLKELIINQLGSTFIEFLDIKTELKSTQYIQNSVPLRTLVVNDLQAGQILFVFDVERCFI